MIGKTLLHYEITARIGAGGMGEVYRATDTKLGREVAIKVLPAEVAGNAEQLARFRREARVLAALNHPGIASIYGLEEGDGQLFLVMELAPGEDLKQRLDRGPIPVEGAVEIAKQIAEALKEAHERGIVHRDLKPANIKLGPEGEVKILDFGLARAWGEEGEPAASDVSSSPTEAFGGTSAGMILGTAAYMSPEQAAGKAVDKRSDIWSFGVVLFEMLTAERLFAGETAPEVLASVIKEEPDLGRLPATCPTPVRTLIRRCLRRPMRERLQDAGDARLELEEISRAGGLADERRSGPALPRRGTAAGIALASLLLGVLLGRLWPDRAGSARPSSEPAHRATIELPGDTPLPLGTVAPAGGFDLTTVALSPDGERLAFVGREGDETALFLRERTSYDVRRLPDTRDARFPFFSPDGAWLGFLTDDKVKKLPLGGESSIALCNAQTPVRAVWSETGVIHFSDSIGSGIGQVEAEGGDCRSVATNLPSQLAPARYTSLSDVLPGGRWGLVSVWRRSMSGDYADVVALDGTTGETRTLIRLGYDARYVETGHLVFVRGGALLGVAFDVRSLEARGDPVTLVTGLSTNSLFGQGQFAVSRAGVLAYVPGGDRAVGRPTWVDRNGAVEALPVDPEIFGVASISPDGHRLAIEVADLEDYVRLYDLGSPRGGQRFVAGGQPVWSPDGRHLTYARLDASGQWTIARQALAGTPAVTLLTRPHRVAPHSWSSDGTILGLTDWGPTSSAFGVGLLHDDGLRYEVGEGGLFPAFSTDGPWLAYMTAKTGRYEVSVRSVDGTAERQVSADGGWEPVWRENGELFWRAGNRFWSSRVTTGEDASSSSPALAFETDFIDTQGRSFDVTPDGRRLLVVKEAEPLNVGRIRIVDDWFAELRQLVPTADPRE